MVFPILTWLSGGTVHDWRQLVKEVRGGSRELIWGKGVQLSRSATVLPDTVEEDQVIVILDI